MVDSILVAGQTFHVMRTPSRSSFWLMKSCHVAMVLHNSLLLAFSLSELSLIDDSTRAERAFIRTRDVTQYTFTAHVNVFQLCKYEPRPHVHVVCRSESIPYRTEPPDCGREIKRI